MVALPEPADTTLRAVEQAGEKGQATDGGRAHLGGSIIGRECKRELWFSFRWGTIVTHKARILRLFARGAREEDWFNHLLTQAGVTVWDVDPDTKQQFRVEAVGGHLGGSLDGVLMGLIEAPQVPHVSEQKTHAAKSFEDVEKKGVLKSKPEHYAQMQVYMHLMELPWALYQAVNKNNDALYYERVEYDKPAAEALIRKAEHIITSDRPPEGISTDPSFYKCKFCDHAFLCHGYQTPALSCRTCAFATAEIDGDARWSCAKHKKDIGVEDQRLACDKHLFIPELLEPWAEVLDGTEEHVSYKNKLTGHEFVNGWGGYSSKEISRARDVNAIGDPDIDHWKESFQAEVIG